MTSVTLSDGSLDLCSLDLQMWCQWDLQEASGRVSCCGPLTVCILSWFSSSSISTEIGGHWKESRGSHSSDRHTPSLMSLSFKGRPGTHPGQVACAVTVSVLPQGSIHRIQWPAVEDDGHFLIKKWASWAAVRRTGPPEPSGVFKTTSHVAETFAQPASLLPLHPGQDSSPPSVSHQQLVEVANWISSSDVVVLWWICNLPVSSSHRLNPPLFFIYIFLIA